ncbi:MAG: YceI family protein [Chitinophagaceae bacterium]
MSKITTVTSVALVIGTSFFLSFCHQDPQKDKAAVSEWTSDSSPAGPVTNWQLLEGVSTLQWQGGHVIGGGGHQGTLAITGGSLQLVADTIIRAGEFTMDMNGIHVTDTKDDGNKGIEEHLRSDDFFSSAKFPQSHFSITGQSRLSTPAIKGNLTIKGITNEIIFPATFSVHQDTLRAKATLSIDRTKWNVMYQAQTISFLTKDNAISNQIGITLDLVFKKSSE